MCYRRARTVSVLNILHVDDTFAFGVQHPIRVRLKGRFHSQSDDKGPVQKEKHGLKEDERKNNFRFMLSRRCFSGFFFRSAQVTLSCTSAQIIFVAHIATVTTQQFFNGLKKHTAVRSFPWFELRPSLLQVEIASIKATHTQTIPHKRKEEDAHPARGILPPPRKQKPVRLRACDGSFFEEKIMCRKAKKGDRERQSGGITESKQRSMMNPLVGKKVRNELWEIAKKSEMMGSLVK
ncbi:hypothetical protein RUM43_001564 [Polyplax serrata]|uniref:Uncharacterized protein n=1 Tax=Polyplax serrata TaxID=468196 RepID=A0AAN8SE34_POLSC